MTRPVTARTAKRLKVFEPAVLHHAGTTARIHLLDFSYTGARLHGAAPLQPGAIVHITCRTLLITARIAWVRGPKYGVTFLTPLRSSDIAALIA